MEVGKEGRDHSDLHLECSACWVSVCSAHMSIPPAEKVRVLVKDYDALSQLFLAAQEDAKRLGREVVALTALRDQERAEAEKTFEGLRALVAARQAEGTIFYLATCMECGRDTRPRPPIPFSTLKEREVWVRAHMAATQHVVKLSTEVRVP